MKNLTLIYKNTLILSVLILNYEFESNKNISIIFELEKKSFDFHF